MVIVGRLATLHLFFVVVVALTKKRVEEAALSRYDSQIGGTSSLSIQGKSKSKFDVTRKFEGKAESQVGVMNTMGVTRYTAKKLRKAKSKDGHFWPDSNSRSGGTFAGATDLADNVSWGWHHPNGVYNTIPVGAPLIDDDMNIYIGSDDAIRKFSISGDLLWIYGPRGQLAAAPTLAISSGNATRLKIDNLSMNAEEEEDLKPDWLKNARLKNISVDQYQYEALFQDLKVGDNVKVRPGFSYAGEGKELYRAGDMGTVLNIIGDEIGKQKAVILWKRSGHETVAKAATLGKRFFHMRNHKETTLPPMMMGSTTSGYVFALDLATGEEVWATQVSDAISGVKGAVAAKDGVVVVATNRCVDRYCYRYRNQTNALWPSNSIVRGLSAMDGSSLWQYKTRSPVWNMVPQWGKDDTVLFQDQEANAYCLKFKTGEVVWRKRGQMGTTTQASALYIKAYNILITMGPKHYDHKYCNPYPAPGILPHCSTWPRTPGRICSLNASSGRMLWATDVDEPPASAAFGKLNSPVGHSRLVVSLGFNCKYNSRSQLLAIDAITGHPRWKRLGPTLWSGMCAGDKEGGDIRRAMGGRAACVPNSWSQPAIDSNGDVYIGSQVGELQRWGAPGGGGTKDVQLLSSLNTGVAFNDMSIAFAPGIMAVSTCTSLIVFGTSSGYFEDGNHL